MNLTINGIDLFFESINQHKEQCVDKMKKGSNNDDKYINSLTAEINTVNSLQSNLMKLRKLIIKRESN